MSFKQQIVGKTGTAQTHSNIDPEDKANKYNSIFIGYTNYQNPKYAISVVIEHGGGGSNAAKVARSIFDYMISIPRYKFI
jgi:penicillin-binding protein 2